MGVGGGSDDQAGNKNKINIKSLRVRFFMVSFFYAISFLNLLFKFNIPLFIKLSSIYHALTPFTIHSYFVSFFSLAVNLYLLFFYHFPLLIFSPISPSCAPCPTALTPSPAPVLNFLPPFRTSYQSPQISVTPEPAYRSRRRNPKVKIY